MITELIALEINKLGDSGYQGLAVSCRPTSYTPLNKTQNQPLTREARKFNPELAGGRIPIQRVNRWCKIFRLVKETYRRKH